MHTVTWHVCWWKQGLVVAEVSGQVHGQDRPAVWVQAASVAAGAALVHPNRPCSKAQHVSMHLSGPGGFTKEEIKRVVDSPALYEVVHTVHSDHPDA